MKTPPLFPPPPKGLLDCPDDFKPVCASDNETYTNQCVFDKQNYILGGKLTIKWNGFCKCKIFFKFVKRISVRSKQQTGLISKDVVGCTCFIGGTYSAISATYLLKLFYFLTPHDMKLSFFSLKLFIRRLSDQRRDSTWFVLLTEIPIPVHWQSRLQSFITVAWKSSVMDLAK